jgi:hypothetical protein
MAGRFLTASFLGAVILLAKQLPSAHPLVARAVVLTAATLSLLMPPSPLRMRPFDLGDPIRAEHGVVDERAVHYAWTGFVSVLH